MTTDLFNKKALVTSVQILNNNNFHRYAVVYNATLFTTDEIRALAIRNENKIFGTGWVSVQNMNALLAYASGSTDLVSIAVEDWCTRITVDRYCGGNTRFDFVLPELCTHHSPRTADHVLELLCDVEKIASVRTPRIKLPRTEHIVFDTSSGTFRERDQNDTVWYRRSYVSLGLNLFSDGEVDIVRNSKNILFTMDPTTGSFYAVAPISRIGG